MDRRRTVFGVFDYIREELGPVMTEAITTRFSRTTTTAVPSSNSSEANTTTHVSLIIETDDEGLGTGGIIGILLGITVLVGLIIGLVFLYKRGWLPGRARKQETVIFSFDTSFQNLIDRPKVRSLDPDTESLTSTGYNLPNRSSSYGGSSQGFDPSTYRSSNFGNAPRRSRHSRYSLRQPPQSHNLSTSSIESEQLASAPATLQPGNTLYSSQLRRPQSHSFRTSSTQAEHASAPTTIQTGQTSYSHQPRRPQSHTFASSSMPSEYASAPTTLQTGHASYNRQLRRPQSHNFAGSAEHASAPTALHIGHAPSSSQSRRSYSTHGLPKITHDRFLYTENIPNYAQRYNTPSFNYRPSRHIDRHLMAYYNWTMNQELPQNVIELEDNYGVFPIPERIY